MKKYLTILFSCISVLGSVSINAQISCGTPQKINFDIESEYLEFRNRRFDESDSSQNLRAMIQVPIQFHVNRPTDGVSDFQPSLVDSIISILNMGFKDTPFTFYQCEEINYIDDDEYATMCYPHPCNDNQDYEAFYNFYNSDVALNIYLAESIFSFLNISAWGHYPWSGNHSYIIGWRNISNTHVHEMGHCLGLYHTHRPGEFVDGSNCLIAGDLCCDTPAEPTLGGSNVNLQCEYFGNETDPNGDLYSPDVGNYMSYSPRACRSLFTDDQIERMRYFYDRYFQHYQCDKKLEYTDIHFEEITTSPYPAVEGEPYDIWVKTVNGGTVKTTNAFYINGQIDHSDIGRSYVTTIFPSNPQYVAFEDDEDFPKEPGRYMVCVDTEGDSLELYHHNNSYCQEILIRQKAGIPDLSISNLSLEIPISEQNTYNPISFNLENIGSIIAENISGLIYVNEILNDSLSVDDLQVGENLTIELDVFLGSESSQEICIEMSPAFTEERLDNNSICLQFSTQEQILSDIEVDSLYIYPNDNLMLQNKAYKIFFSYINNGPTPAWGNTSYLSINNIIRDSIKYPLNWGQGGNPRIDSFDVVLTEAVDSVEFCVMFDTYRDTILQNNTLCLTKPLQSLTNTSEYSFQEGIVIYPNPFIDEVKISSSEPIETIEIYNMLGNQVKGLDVFNLKETSLHLADLPTGLYKIFIDTQPTRKYGTILKIE